ncbi:MAG: mannose-6-phosphate isomerase, class I [Desulfobacterales bacterium]|jgi:mannose-6-phosphate isomerase|nr:mannose-6-phosphate isomerase, class I [Desulfobacteraceae bacterium]MBT4365350.1 mannose-6-phosphate isomerase, class I [Desulfobacteraceae bacterium]MBT7084742.1 mannose-6-phosphate isomerase, class I [Desulfobacterales bacterium]MBT7696056.1 mannose-6-phosphate isomerase, class I [Desulfobacterales bacterium]
MSKIYLLKNTIQEYAWGSYTAINELLGKGPGDKTDKPQAELWMGAHPKAPSLVKYKGKWVSLSEIIIENQQNILGDEVNSKFDGKLPYLFKVLAAAKPLSIQAHPSLSQAKEGFENENREGIPLNALSRNYKDDNHKPECICALTSFWALNGFRMIPEILSYMDIITPPSFNGVLDILRKEPNSSGLKIFFNSLMTMEKDKQKQIITGTVENVLKLSKKDPVYNPVYKWIVKLNNEYPGDIGVFAPVLLNLICLEPGQAMFLPSGELHAYLEGVGIELMANSDNVLRGGLTPKHVDLKELLKVLNFREREVEILLPVRKNNCESIYESRADEFVLSVVKVSEKNDCSVFQNRSVEIILCIEGNASVSNIHANGDAVMLEKGTSVLIPASIPEYEINGNATLYKASIPL